MVGNQNHAVQICTRTHFQLHVFFFFSVFMTVYLNYFKHLRKVVYGASEIFYVNVHMAPLVVTKNKNFI